MGASSVTVEEMDGYMWVTARGGTRRERGAAIGAAVRGRRVKRLSISYSETYGFLSATYARYEVF